MGVEAALSTQLLSPLSPLPPLSSIQIDLASYQGGAQPQMPRVLWNGPLSNTLCERADLLAHQSPGLMRCVYT